MNYNRVMLMGNLTRDPEVKYLPSGNPVIEFGMAINRMWNDTASGERREAVTFVDCKAFGRMAETLAQYVGKGQPLFVEGRLDYREWESEGRKRSKLEVVVDSFQFVGGKRDGGKRKPEPEQAHESTYGQPPPEDDEIPF